MIPAKQYLEASTNGRRLLFDTCSADRPLVAQVSGNQPGELLAARDHFGAFLMDDPQLAASLVTTLANGLSVPVCCKIRVFSDVQEAARWAKLLEGWNRVVHP